MKQGNVTRRRDFFYVKNPARTCYGFDRDRAKIDKFSYCAVSENFVKTRGNYSVFLCLLKKLSKLGAVIAAKKCSSKKRHFALFRTILGHRIVEIDSLGGNCIFWTL